MNSAIHLPGDRGAGAEVAPYATSETLRIGIGRRTLRVTGLVDRLRETAGT